MAGYSLKWGKETLDLVFPCSWHVETMLPKQARNGGNDKDPVEIQVMEGTNDILKSIRCVSIIDKNMKPS